MDKTWAHLQHEHVLRLMEYFEDLLLLLINGETPFLALQAKHKSRPRPFVKRMS